MYGAQSGEFVCRSWGLKGEKRALMEVGGSGGGGGGGDETTVALRSSV